MKKRNILLSCFIYASWLILLIAGISDLFNNPYRAIIWFSSLLILILIYIKLNKIPNYAHALLSLIMLFNVFGELVFEFYYNYAFYDKILHFIDPIIISIFIYNLAKPYIKNKKFAVMFSIFTVISLGAAWEIIEYGFDNTFGTMMQGTYILEEDHFFSLTKRTEVFDKLKDTMGDMLSNILGVLTFAIGFYLYSNRKNIESRTYKS